jgi:uncharacterized membrane protein
MPQVPLWQRLLAALAYLLPWSDGVMFGRSLFALFPPLQWLALPALPVLQVEQLLPFGGFLLFLALYFGVVRNGRVPYPIRFHVLQAILVDIVLIVLGLAFQILLRPLGAGFVLRTLENTVFLGMAVLVLFAVLQTLRGKEADIPTLSEAVRLQLY